MWDLAPAACQTRSGGHSCSAACCTGVALETIGLRKGDGEMEVGLLWYDNDPQRALEDKVGRAAQRYHDKYGRWPNTCYVHPQAVAELTEAELQIMFRLDTTQGKIRLISAPNILQHHYWVGESNGRAQAKRRQPAN